MTPKSASTFTEPLGVESVPLELWEPPHPVTRALLAGVLPMPTSQSGDKGFRSPQLAEALTALNRRWDNPVDRQLEDWLQGAEAVVAGQQPGLLGGPILTLVKACAVAAQVAKLQAAGKPAVGFFWLETRDDDLPEMGWARLVLGGQLFSMKELWRRGQACACAVPLSSAVEDFLASLPTSLLPTRSPEALAFAKKAFQTNVTLGEACGCFLAHLLRDLGLVIVDASLPQVARASAAAGERLLSRLDKAWELIFARSESLSALNLPEPLRLRPDRLPFFAIKDGKRHALPQTQAQGAWKKYRANPEQLSPNVWVRPLLQDAALDTSVAILGSSELAYHWVVQDLWALAEVRRPQWLLRPHVTLASPREARWLKKLNVSWEIILSGKLPPSLYVPKALVRQVSRVRSQTLANFKGLLKKAQDELPNLAAELEATANRLESAFAWLDQKLNLRAQQRAETQMQRFAQLENALRPLRNPQERALSILSPFLNLPEVLTYQLTDLLAHRSPWRPDMLIVTWEAAVQEGNVRPLR